jgi:glycosyltransferase involved in cell wall biosynthesis
MDRVASMLYRHVQRSHGARVAASLLCPPFATRFTRFPGGRRLRLAEKADRFLNRFCDYPRAVARAASGHDVFHIIDHSYAHLAHALPGGRTVITCHDVDAFRSISGPDRERRSAAFRAAARRILTGLQRAARVVCDTAAIRDELLSRGLVREDRLTVVPLGVDDVFSADPQPAADRHAGQLLPWLPGEVEEILHVGSTVARKRIDVLLRVCASLRARFPRLRLVRVGDPLTADQQRLCEALGLGDRVVSLGTVDEPTLAALYRRAAVVLQPSEREGFGLPVIEAMACGTPVVASDLPALREIGGDEVEYCRMGDVAEWQATVARLLAEQRDEPLGRAERCARSRRRAGRFTWNNFATAMTDIYSSLAPA